MDGRHFDDLTRATTAASSRRRALGLLIGAALTAALAQITPLAAKKKGKGKNKKKCRKQNQGCGGKKKCCRGLTCTNSTCQKPNQPECTVNNDCGINETCQNGVCVPNDFECSGDDDCDGNEICSDGSCVCPLELGGECVVPCNSGSECPGQCNSCRGVFPGDGDRVVCVDEPFLLCDDAIACDQVDECPSGFICAFTTCDSPAGSGRCFPITCDG